MLLQLVRRFHTGFTSRSLDSSLLAKLRKKTGYTIANCKKALEMHANDANKAETWLHEQAQSMGWAKATKLAGRQASQGLVAVKYDNSHGVLVEMNCETDFVARNNNFKMMMEQVVSACYKFTHTQIVAKGPVTKMSLDQEQLSSLHGNEGKTLGEHLVLMIGILGENAKLQRALCWKSNSEDIKIAGYAHPNSADTSSFESGKYAALLAYRQDKDLEDIGKNLCQHIVGMNPKKLGDPETDKPAKDSDEEECLIYQEYLLDPTMTVQELLTKHKAEVVDFSRFILGGSVQDELPGIKVQPLDTVKTLQ